MIVEMSTGRAIFLAATNPVSSGRVRLTDARVAVFEERRMAACWEKLHSIEIASVA
jgi:hypothetical protein